MLGFPFCNSVLLPASEEDFVVFEVSIGIHSRFGNRGDTPLSRSSRFVGQSIVGPRVVSYKYLGVMVVVLGFLRILVQIGFSERPRRIPARAEFPRRIVTRYRGSLAFRHFRPDLVLWCSRNNLPSISNTNEEVLTLLESRK